MLTSTLMRIFPAMPVDDETGFMRPDKLNIKIIDPESNEVFYKLKKTSKLGKVRMAWADRADRSLDTTRFTYKGMYVADNETAESVSLEFCARSEKVRSISSEGRQHACGASWSRKHATLIVQVRRE